MKIFKQKKIEDLPYKLDYYEYSPDYVYKLDFNTDNNSCLLFKTEEDLKNFVIYHQIKDYSSEIVEIISNNLKFGDKIE